MERKHLFMVVNCIVYLQTTCALWPCVLGVCRFLFTPTQLMHSPQTTEGSSSINIFLVPIKTCRLHWQRFILRNKVLLKLLQSEQVLGDLKSIFNISKRQRSHSIRCCCLALLPGVAFSHPNMPQCTIAKICLSLKSKWYI